MIKSELIARLARKETHLPEKKVGEVVKSILGTMSEAMVDGQRIEIRGFGSFELRLRPPRQAHNPKTGERVMTETKQTPHFKPGKELRERVDASKNRYAVVEDKS